MGPSAVHRQQTAKTLIARGLFPGGDKIVPRREKSSRPHFLSPKRKRPEPSAQVVVGADPCVRPWFRVSCRGNPLGRPVGVGWALPTISLKWHRLFLSFPSSCLGTHLWRQALLGESRLASGRMASEQSRSFALKWVPKQELGNQKKIGFRRSLELWFFVNRRH